jgi:hypothetical protein
MDNDTTSKNQNHTEILAATIAHLTAGNQDQSKSLFDLLNTLDEVKANELTQKIMRYGPDTDINKLIYSPIDESPQDRFHLYHISEALKYQSPIEWVVKPLLSKGSVSLWVGDPASKKTYSIMDLALCVAIGGPWLDFETIKGPVLFIDEESGKRRLDDRMGQVLRGHLVQEDETFKTSFHYFTLDKFNLREESDLVVMEETIKKLGASLVVIDMLPDVMPGADENSVKDVQPVFMAVRGIADRTQSNITILHHANRSGSFRGSSALLGAVDVMIKVESKQGNDLVNFKVEKNRDGEPQNFSAIANFSTEQFRLSASEYKTKQDFSLSKRYVLHFLATKGASLVEDIKSHADRCSPDAARKAVYALADEGYANRVDEGGPGEKATYDITEKGLEAAKAILDL